MDNRDNIADKFRVVLCRHLKDRFGKIISAQRFADQYNLKAHGTTPISRETARRWIRGSAIPDYGHLLALVRWLELDPDEFLGNEGHTPVASQRLVPITNGQAGQAQVENLMKVLECLDEEIVGTLVTIAEALARRADRAKPAEFSRNAVALEDQLS